MIVADIRTFDATDSFTLSDTTKTYKRRSAIRFVENAFAGFIAIADKTPPAQTTSSASTVNSQYTTGLYYDAEDFIITGESYAPKIWQSWEAINIFHTEPTGTELRYRLNNGTDDHYWDGGAWAVATTQWNTKSEIEDNISDYTETSVALIIKMRTDDEEVTPLFYGAVIMAIMECNPYYDLFGTTLVGAFKDMRIEARYENVFASTTDMIDLSSNEMKYDFREIDHVYLVSGGVVDRTTDYYQSFDIGTQVITLTGDLNANDRVRIFAKVSPDVVYIHGSQGYLELDKLPAVIIDRVDTAHKYRTQGSELVKKGDHYYQLPNCNTHEFDVTVRLSAGFNYDRETQIEAFEKFFTDNPSIQSNCFDKPVNIYMIRRPDILPIAIDVHIFEASTTFRLGPYTTRMGNKETVRALDEVIINLQKLT